MNLPIDLRRLVGEYATSSLFDLASMMGSGFLRSHPKALTHVKLEFQDVEKACKVVNQEMFGGVRFLKLDFTSDNDLKRLVALAPMLEELDIGHCGGLTHTHKLGDLRRLTKLTMTGCRHFYGFSTDTLRDLELTQCAPVGGDLSSLRRLTLHNCTVQKVTKMSPVLEHLELNANYSAVDLEDWSGDAWDLGNLPNMKELIISTSHSLSNKHVAGVRNMRELEKLTMTCCPEVTDFSFLQGLSKLRYLKVSNNFDWSMIKHVELESFSATEFTLEDLLHLGGQRRLQFLRLDQGRGDVVGRVDPGPILMALLPQWPKLHTLDLFFCNQFVETQGFPLTPGLKCLKIDFCKLITDERLVNLLRSFPELEMLSIKFTRVSDVGLLGLPLSIRELALRGCVVTDKSLAVFAKLQNLTSLDIAHTQISRVDKLPKSLKTLYITGSSLLISPDHVLTLRRRRVKIVQDY
jgi:hypothetical protein